MTNKTNDNQHLEHIAGERISGEQIADNMAKEITRLSNINAELLETLEMIGKACGIQANLNSTATREQRSEFISIIFDLWNDIILPLTNKAKGSKT